MKRLFEMLLNLFQTPPKVKTEITHYDKNGNEIFYLNKYGVSFKYSYDDRNRLIKEESFYNGALMETEEIIYD